MLDVYFHDCSALQSDINRLRTLTTGLATTLNNVDNRLRDMDISFWDGIRQDIHAILQTYEKEAGNED
jgi:hypothetical protein